MTVDLKWDLLIIRCECDGFVRELWREIGEVVLRLQARSIRRRNLFLLQLKDKSKEKDNKKDNETNDHINWALKDDKRSGI